MQQFNNLCCSTLLKRLCVAFIVPATRQMETSLMNQAPLNTFCIALIYLIKRNTISFCKRHNKIKAIKVLHFTSAILKAWIKKQGFFWVQCSIKKIKVTRIKKIFFYCFKLKVLPVMTRSVCLWNKSPLFCVLSTQFAHPFNSAAEVHSTISMRNILLPILSECDVCGRSRDASTGGDEATSVFRAQSIFFFSSPHPSSSWQETIWSPRMKRT